LVFKSVYNFGGILCRYYLYCKFYTFVRAFARISVLCVETKKGYSRFNWIKLNYLVLLNHKGDKNLHCFYAANHILPTTHFYSLSLLPSLSLPPSLSLTHTDINRLFESLYLTAFVNLLQSLLTPNDRNGNFFIVGNREREDKKCLSVCLPWPRKLERKIVKWK